MIWPQMAALRRIGDACHRVKNRGPKDYPEQVKVIYF